MNEFKSAQTIAIEQAIEAETARQVRIQTGRMRCEQFEREKKARLAELRDRAIKALAAVEVAADVSPQLKKALADVSLSVLENRKSKRAQTIELENLQDAISEL